MVGLQLGGTQLELHTSCLSLQHEQLKAGSTLWFYTLSYVLQANAET